MKIIIDDKIPYIKGALEPFAEVVYAPGAKITSEMVKDADALIIRTLTICNAGLLEGSTVKFIASATAGFDHIDTEYCRRGSIQWTNAPGCNAESVNQYIASTLFSYARRKSLRLAEKTIGIVGVGQVGSRVARLCRIIGMTVLLNDPPRERGEGGSQVLPLAPKGEFRGSGRLPLTPEGNAIELRDFFPPALLIPEGKPPASQKVFVELEEIKQKADIITFHVPLNLEGPDATFHLVDEDFLQGLSKSPLLINSSRGEVFDTKSVIRARKTGLVSGLILDVWENEPDLDLELLNLADYGTPHIAGYSRDGKANGTRTSVRAVSRFFGLGIDGWEPEGAGGPLNAVIDIDGYGKSEAEVSLSASEELGPSMKVFFHKD